MGYTRNLKQPWLLNPPISVTPGEWTWSDTEKVKVFSKHICNVFQPSEDDTTSNKDELFAQLEAPFQLSSPSKTFSPGERGG